MRCGISFSPRIWGPRATRRRLSSDPANFSIEPISIGRPYSKQNLVRRRQADILYGQLASQRIASFAPDVTISGNTPLEAQAPILRGVRQAGSAFVFWMQDFYSLAAAKILSRKIPVVGHAIGAYYRRLEASMLRRSDGIVLASEDFRPALKDFGVRDDAADVIPNWGALDTLPLRPKDNSWAMQHGLSGKFVFLYAGTLALKHNPDLLWALAEHFEADPDVVIAVAASGVSYDALKARSGLEPKPNLVFLPAPADGRLPGCPRCGRRPRRAARKRCGAVLRSLESSQLSLRRPSHPLVRAAQQSFGATGRGGRRRALCPGRRQARLSWRQPIACEASSTPVPSSAPRAVPMQRTPSASRVSPIALKPCSARRSAQPRMSYRAECHSGADSLRCGHGAAIADTICRPRLDQSKRSLQAAKARSCRRLSRSTSSIASSTPWARAAWSG